MRPCPDAHLSSASATSCASYHTLPPDISVYCGRPSSKLLLAHAMIHWRCPPPKFPWTSHTLDPSPPPNRQLAGRAVTPENLVHLGFPPETFSHGLQVCVVGPPGCVWGVCLLVEQLCVPGMCYAFLHFEKGAAKILSLFGRFGSWSPEGKEGTEMGCPFRGHLCCSPGLRTTSSDACVYT